jgi:hypothetical protein
MYSGDKCEAESNELKTVKAIISYTTIIAIITIILFYSSIILMDLSKFCCKNQENLHRHKKPVIEKYIYIN